MSNVEKLTPVLTNPAAIKVVNMAEALEEAARGVKAVAGVAAFDILVGGATDANAEKELASAKGQIETYESVANDLRVIASQLNEAPTTVPMFTPGDLGTVKVNRLRNVPTMNLCTSLTFPHAEEETIFVDSGDTIYQVLVKKVEVIEVSDTTTETVMVGKVLGTLVPGLVGETKATITGRAQTKKANTAAKPKADPGKKPAPTRKPRKPKSEESPKDAQE